MTLKKVIRKGDTTSHGGTVLEGIDGYLIFDQPIACKGHRVSCPLCQGTFPIIEGVEGQSIYDKFPAVEGMKTACGAELIASQDYYQLEQLDKANITMLPYESTEINDKWSRSNLGEFGVRFQLMEGEGEEVYYLADMPYKAYLSDGSIREGYTDSEGYTNLICADEELTVEKLEVISETADFDGYCCMNPSL